MRFSRRKRRHQEIAPDEILIDASNISDFNRDQFEGRIERPLGQRTFVVSGSFLALLFVFLLFRAGNLQIVHGAAYAKQARENQITQKVVFADRGVIVDRTGLPLAYNERLSVTDDFATRRYAAMRGIAHVVGYAKSPAKDSSGVYYRNSFTGVDGAERAYDKLLAGKNGAKLTEEDAHSKVVSESVTEEPEAGAQMTLSIDAKVTEGLYDSIARLAEQSGFQGGAGVIMDVQTGGILALTSYPEFSLTALMTGDTAALLSINADTRQPFLNRATSGLYAPGSIVKPVVAAAVLNEGVISENKQILSTGSISIPNPYDKTKPSVFRDWKAHGWVDVRHAIAVSSDVYFYEVGGGFEGQAGLGIDRLDTYFKMFGFGLDAGLVGYPEQVGNIPTPSWKAKTFTSDQTWRIGDTYHTAIGQYGMQVTPLQAVRATAALANGGKLLIPTMLASTTPKSEALRVDAHALQIVREGMRLGVTEGIAGAVKLNSVAVAAKTGTAQIGAHNEYINSWMVGFFPYEHPKYAYAVVLERGPAHTTMGSPAAVGQFLLWMEQHAPQYLR